MCAKTLRNQAARKEQEGRHIQDYSRKGVTVSAFLRITYTTGHYRENAKEAYGTCSKASEVRGKRH